MSRRLTKDDKLSTRRKIHVLNHLPAIAVFTPEKAAPVNNAVAPMVNKRTRLTENIQVYLSQQKLPVPGFPFQRGFIVINAFVLAMTHDPVSQYQTFPESADFG